MMLIAPENGVNCMDLK